MADIQQGSGPRGYEGPSRQLAPDVEFGATMREVLAWYETARTQLVKDYSPGFGPEFRARLLGLQQELDSLRELALERKRLQYAGGR